MIHVRMLKQTKDIFILNRHVYWRYIWIELSTGKGYVKETYRDGFFCIDYQNNIKEEINSETFYRNFRRFQRVKELPRYWEQLMPDVLANIWLTTILRDSVLFF
jgi:hypothetical protein